MWGWCVALLSLHRYYEFRFLPERKWIENLERWMWHIKYKFCMKPTMWTKVKFTLHIFRKIKTDKDSGKLKFLNIQKSVNHAIICIFSIVRKIVTWKDALKACDTKIFCPVFWKCIFYIYLIITNFPWCKVLFIKYKVIKLLSALMYSRSSKIWIAKFSKILYNAIIKSK